MYEMRKKVESSVGRGCQVVYRKTIEKGLISLQHDLVLLGSCRSVVSLRHRLGLRSGIALHLTYG